MGELFDTLERMSDEAMREDWDELGELYAPGVEAWSPTDVLKGRNPDAAETGGVGTEPE